ncbi:hypothetical protein [Mycobacterium sp. SMC-19]|uniref:hypothetical protein n=1 Tax=Mycobacterium sp. SMC-19 TaxID=3381630 RepID=UPI003876CC1B
MTACLTRMHLFADADDADSLVVALSAVAGTPLPEWQPYTRKDGVDARSATVLVGAASIVVTVGAPALPALLMLSVPDVAAAVERLNGAGFSARVDRHGEAAITVPGEGIVIRLAPGGSAK